MNTVGLIGCGSIAQLKYTSLFRIFFPGTRKLFYDIHTPAAEAMAGSLGGQSTSLAELLQQSDFIIITTPPDSHYELLRQAVMPGKTIFCEKPFLLNKSHADHIIQLSQTHQALVYAGHVRRFYPAMTEARKFFETGLLGKLLKADIYEGGRFNYASASGYHYTNPWGGVLPDTGSHSLDCFLYATGLDKAQLDFVLESRSSQPEPAHEYEASFKILTETNPIEAHISLSRRVSLANKLNLYCEQGVMEVPLDFRNAVKISTAKGKSILRNEFPVTSIEDAFNRQFRHILYEGGHLLEAHNFLNTTKVLETLLEVQA